MSNLRICSLMVTALVLSLLLPTLPLWAQSPFPTVLPLIPPIIREHTIGTSLQGRPITAIQVGNGPHKLVVVGNTHGAPEANTYYLALDLVEYFLAHPEAVPQAVRLYIIPTINPDGLALGERFNASRVDLNRNMNTNRDACPENDWKMTVEGAYGIISDTGGSFAESEPESQLIRDFLLDASGAIFLHSNAGLVFPAYCEHPPSNQMAQVYAHASGYAYRRFWDRYMITGSMPDWASSIGIAAITPELDSPVEKEFDQNLAGIQAVLKQADVLFPPLHDHVEEGIPIPALIWRYWSTHGGIRVLGQPLEPARATMDGMIQTFTNVRLQLRISQTDTPYLVQPIPLGVEHVRRLHHGAVGEEKSISGISESIVFEQTGHRLYGAFLNYWQQHGGLNLFGYPISDEFVMVTADEQQRTVQYFERAALAYYPEDNTVRLEPLGWQTLLVEQLQKPTVAPQIR